MRKAILGAVVLLLGIATTAAADPVTLTSGEAFAYWDASLTTFNAFGSGFSVFGSGVGDGFVVAFDVGQTLTPSTPFDFFPGPLDHGSMTIAGVTYPGFVRGNLQVAATPFVVQDSSNGQFSTRFTLSGLVQLFPSQSSTAPLFSEDVTGTGVMSFGTERIAPETFLSRSGLRLTFDEGTSGSPTPEPASLLLLASGLAAAWQFRRFRRVH